jgi:hypothetical protein
MGWCTILLENGAVSFSYFLWEHKVLSHIQANCSRDGAPVEEAGSNIILHHMFTFRLLRIRSIRVHGFSVPKILNSDGSQRRVYEK